jgi:hypothetical protein
MLLYGLRLMITIGMMGSAMALAARPEGRVVSHTDSKLLQRPVGAVRKKCCLWGRRWGCAPANFGQTGCVPLYQYPNCWAAPDKTMPCTSAKCQTAGSEDVCDVSIRLVGLNVCKPTGFKTTVGCPANQWQCQVLMLRYDSPTAPKVQALVCDGEGVTICPFNYSKCN